jgi:hypothetical protein
MYIVCRIGGKSLKKNVKNLRDPQNSSTLHFSATFYYAKFEKKPDFSIHRYRNIIGLIILQGINSIICIIQCRPHYYTFTLTSSSQRHTSTTLIISAIEEEKKDAMEMFYKYRRTMHSFKYAECYYFVDLSDFLHFFLNFCRQFYKQYTCSPNP